MVRDIPLLKIYWDERDTTEVSNAIRTGMSWAVGPCVPKFETELAKYIGTEYALAFNSGTSALHAILAAYGIGKGDEVIVPSFTFIATANAPVFVGATPVFADIEEKTYGLDPKDVRAKITSKTKAIIPIHYAGCPCLIEELRDIAKERGLLLIEDAAEAFGAEVRGKKAGSFGDASILSFCQNKIITTGEGGAVVTDSRDIYEKLKLLRSHGRLDTADYFTSMEYMDYVTLGYNFRMSNLTAALGLAQMEKADKIIRMRRKNAQHMNQKLSEVNGVVIWDVPDGFHHVYQLYTVRVPAGQDARDRLMKHLSSKGVMSKVYFYPAHLTQFYRRQFGHREGELPVTERLSSEVITLPMYPALSKAEMNYVVDQIQGFFS